MSGKELTFRESLYGEDAQGLSDISYKNTNPIYGDSSPLVS